MKRNVIIAVIGIVLFTLGCSHDIEKSSVENYTPPTIKEQPKLFYPVYAQENSIYGNIKASLRIDKTGHVEKVFIFQSAGSIILDNAVKEFCSKLVFIPASLNGQAIDSRVIWEVKFNFTDDVFSANEYLKNIAELYELANRSIARERMKLLQEAIERHIKYINKNSDALNFNNVMSKLIDYDIVREWKDYWNSYPLSFLIFHDFMKRFSDYDSIEFVKATMFNSLRNDLQYIESFSASSQKEKNVKEVLIQKIKNFMNSNYPGKSVLISKKHSENC